MKCQDFRELIDSYLSDELLTETNHEVLRHLEQCAGCREVTRDRRIFRERLRSAVQNCQDFQICEKFNANLYESLKQTALPPRSIKKSFWGGRFSLAAATAAAAGLLVIAAVGVLFLGYSGSDFDPKVEVSDEMQDPQMIYFQALALGDHRKCALEHRIGQRPEDIDLSEPQYAGLKEGVQIPLKNKFGRCELIDAHICRYQGHDFTHLVFKPEGRTMSVLILELSEGEQLKESGIAKLSTGDFQIARFDVEHKAVFVVSDLPEQENFSAAETVETPLRRELSQIHQARLLGDFGFGISDLGFFNRVGFE
ncbi:MAG: zf-HC2 domain-containing protein [Pyrinomonadaceae bacterium]